MKKKFLILVSTIITTALLISVCMSLILVSADVPIKMMVNGKQLNTDVAPYTVNGKVMVPFKATLEALGASFTWDEENQTALGLKELTYIFVQPDNKNAIILVKKANFQGEITSENLEQAVESSKTVTLDVVPALKNKQLMVPASFIAVSLGAKMTWDDKTRTVHITTLTSNTINSKIIGEWEYHFNQQTLLTTPTVSNSIHMKITINKNGTFQSRMETTGTSVYGVTTMTGKYKIDGGMFVIYDGKKSFVPNKYIGGSGYKDKPVNNLKYKVSYNAKEDILVWNNWRFDRTKKAASDAGLIALWSSQGPTGVLVDPVTGYATGSISNGEWYLFRKDGTFRYVIISSGQILSGGVVWDGKFVSGDGKIILTDIKESWYPDPSRKGQKAAYKNLSVKDTTLQYQYKDKGDTLLIGTLDYYHKVK